MNENEAPDNAPAPPQGTPDEEGKHIVNLKYCYPVKKVLNRSKEMSWKGIENMVPTVLENPGKSLNLEKKIPGLESPLKSIKVLESPGIYLQLCYR